MTAPLLARCIASPPSSPRCVSPRWSRRGVSPCRAVAAPTGRSCSPIAPSQVDRWRRSRSSHGKGRRVPAAGKPPTFRFYLGAHVLLHLRCKYSCLMEDMSKHASKSRKARPYLYLHPSWVICRPAEASLPGPMPSSSSTCGLWSTLLESFPVQCNLVLSCSWAL
uniref:Uncharacterized protein n=1 Tax=Setaria viridis TaxID=4556 RepID=A0A4U6TZD6_SETVI|nr:hypothetical protein SEVIR_6G026750v2 [Setaria viridis]